MAGNWSIRDPDALKAYVAAGAARVGLWRVVLGVLLLGLGVIGLVIGASIAYAVWARAISGARGPVGASLAEFITDGGPVGVLVGLGAVAFLWPLLWVVLRVLHRQRLATLFAPEGRIHWREFLMGAMMLLALSAALTLVTFPFGQAPERTATPYSAWLLTAPPVAAMIFLQATAEELVFRGYLLQQLALRWRNPFAWAVVPSLLFCLLHLNPGLPMGTQVLYVGATFLFGVTAAITVARTGSLATAMGMHVTSNILAVTIVAQEGLWEGASLFVQPTGSGEFALGLVSLALLFVWVVSPWFPRPAQPSSESRATAA